MKRLNLTLISICMMCTLSAQNPFFSTYPTPHETIPFDRIKPEHYEPAFLEGMKRHLDEIDAIVNQPETPTFKNTIVAFETSGSFLTRVSSVFHNLNSAETNDEMQALARKIIPQLSAHHNSIRLNEKLFARVKAVYEQNDKELGSEQSMLLDRVYEGFVRNGANLEGEARERYRELNIQLSTLTLQFSERNLKEGKRYKLVITDRRQLAGLPESIVEAAAHTAAGEGVEGWVFTMDAPSYAPFMKYADNRDLRKELYMAYSAKCTHDNEYNTEDIVRRIVNTRMEIAQLLGYDNYAEYTLKKRMAEKSEAVYGLLDQLLEAYTPHARREVEAVKAIARITAGADVELMPWDWSYYSNKLMEKAFDLNGEMLRPYFELGKVKEGVLGLATKLYGITFKKNPDIPVYHEDVDAYEVFDEDGSFLAVLYTDFHPRAGKRAGAWMNTFKDQWIDEETGENSRPHVVLVMNFTQPSADRPALLTFNEVKTFLHEFGHGLHGIFANTVYKSLSGTSVYRDFVELPSQLMENFAVETTFLHTFARHYQTGEVIPADLIQRIRDTSNFNVATLCLRQLSFGLLDMAWYTRRTPFEGDVKAYEKEAWAKAQYLPMVDGTCMSARFSHIFSGGYAAGYYSYKWAEVLDADAFALFREKGLFNRDVARSFRDHILSKGGTVHPMTLYRRFRGQDPTIDALLIRNGIK
jgi:peptidyl-dipeptidase Dcp